LLESPVTEMEPPPPDALTEPEPLPGSAGSDEGAAGAAKLLQPEVGRLGAPGAEGRFGADQQTVPPLLESPETDTDPPPPEAPTEAEPLPGSAGSAGSDEGAEGAAKLLQPEVGRLGAPGAEGRLGAE
jgi:hypothetical protein